MVDRVDRRAVCPACNDAGQAADDCRMCMALNGELDPAEAGGSFLGALNSVGRFRDAIEHHKRTSVAAQMRMARKGEDMTLNRVPIASEKQRVYVEAETVPDTRTPEEIAEDAAIRAQSFSEGVQTGKVGGKLDRRVDFMGKKFRIANKVGLMPLMEFAYFANSGADTADMGSLVAIYEMLKDCISDADEWAAFVKHAKTMKADAEDLMPVVQQTIELLTARPTRQDSVSSVSPRGTSESLTDNSSGQAQHLMPVTDLGRVASLG